MECISALRLRITGLLVATIAFLSTSCAHSTSSPPPHNIREVQGSRQERIYALSRIMRASAREQLMQSVVDANVIVEQFGDGNMGPSDFRHFGKIRVLPPDVARWTTPPTRIESAPAFAGAPVPVSWWLTEKAFQRLTFYESRPIFGQDGWIGASPEGVLYFSIMTR